MPGPPKQFDRDEALGRAMEVFWAHGFDGTSYEALVSGMGLSRSSLYATFGDKQALFLQVLKAYGDQQLAMLTAALKGEGSPLARLQAGLSRLLRTLAQKAGGGCLLVNATCELGDDDDVAAMIRRFRQRVEDQLKQLFERAISDGELATTTNPRTLARLTTTFISGMAVALRAGQTIKNLDLQVEQLMEMIHAYRVADR